MGVPMIKAKAEVNYRTGSKKENCGLCADFIESANRCPVIGVKTGRGYAISVKGVCDQFEEARGEI